jgi:hypothetical protein
VRHNAAIGQAEDLGFRGLDTAAADTGGVVRDAGSEERGELVDHEQATASVIRVVVGHLIPDEVKRAKGENGAAFGGGVTAEAAVSKRRGRAIEIDGAAIPA